MVSHADPAGASALRRVCLVTEELPGFGPSGGIGAAFEEMALLLVRAGHAVTVLYCGPLIEDGAMPAVPLAALRHAGVEVLALDTGAHTRIRNDLRAASWAVWCTLRESDGDFDVVHFHDYKGLGFYACEGRRQGLALHRTRIVVQLHGPTRWTVEANGRFFTEDAQVLADHLERRSVELADERISPSAYLADWVARRWGPEGDLAVRVIPNLCGRLEDRLGRIRARRASGGPGARVRNLVIFGRHEDRKGIDVAVAALGRLDARLAELGVTVHFVGQQGTLQGRPSALYLLGQAPAWTFGYTFNFGLDRLAAGRYLSLLEDVLVVVPAPVENSPYAVLEPLALGLPVLSSLEGGGAELVAEGDRASFCCRMDGESLAAAIDSLVGSALPECRRSSASREVEERWLDFHEEPLPERRRLARQDADEPLVTVGITHHERPHKLGDAVVSMLRQDYARVEIIVVDDGTSDADAVESLDELSRLLERTDVTLLREPNRYLGAARNKVLEHARGEYVLFLDDDDVALPGLVSTLVRSAARTGASVTACMSHYMDERVRLRTLAGQVAHDRVDYFPSAGPLALALEQNVYGAATALVRTEDLREVGGYSELRGVGHEDYELYIRLAQAGKRFSVCPAALFLYEVGRPSMLSATGLDRGFRRCFDAVDFALAPEAWSDYANLNVGRGLGPRSRERLAWLNSLEADADERDLLCDPSTSARDYVETAARVAERAGAARLATAFRDAFVAADHLKGLPLPDARAAAPEDHPLRRLPAATPTTAREAVPTMSRELRRVRHHLLAGDVGRALDELARWLGATRSVDDTALVVIRELADLEATPTHGSAAELVVEVLGDKPFRGPAERMLLALLRLTHRYGLAGPRAEIVERLIGLGREDYLERHPDVREGQAFGCLEPFEHFLAHGREEGRGGFEGLSDALDQLRAVSGQTWTIDDLLELRRPEPSAAPFASTGPERSPAAP